MRREKLLPFLSIIASLLCLGFIACNGNADHSDGLDRHPAQLEYSKHARCRMECRHINETEIKEILEEGTVNERKSDPNGHPCPAYALEGNTKEHQRLRIVFGQCDASVKVITVIDLDTEWSCDCPGDNSKNRD